jgi:triacylglycerol lipase
MIYKMPKSVRNEYVILLHGLLRSDRCMNSLASYLSQSGFEVVNIGYPSRKYPIEQLVQLVAKKLEPVIKKSVETGGCIHFVAHSLGGIIIRYYLKDKPLKNLGRVVMLGPPNQGSEIVDKLKNIFLYQWITGPVGQQLGTEPSSVPNQLGAVDFELGVIAGDRTLDPIGYFLLPRKNDGKVSVKRTQIEGMSDFLLVHRSHYFIMNSLEVQQQTVYFLRNGKFLIVNC